MREFYARYDAAGERESYFRRCRQGYEGSAEARQLELKLDRIAKFAGVSPDLLDVGCGTGVFLDMVRKKGWRGRGIEVSPTAARYARDVFGLDVIEAGIESWPGDGETYDVVTMFDVLEHLRDPIEAVRKIRNRLREGGILVLEVPNQEGLLDRAADVFYHLGWRKPVSALYNLHHIFYFNARSLSRLLRNAGFVILEIGQDSTYVGRVTFENRMIKWGSWTLLKAGRILGMENKLVLTARKEEAVPLQAGGADGGKTDR
ncbi:MAG: hypothetical protein A2V83_07395 [Nitrospirae bacterium RBG_16_64_22]|nr:MAG: hypothetical protein A2V83_07395 [Nitrospirae bacterium RBG_16_64_22]